MTISMKRYQARDMRTALKQVRLEQGADAVILSTQTLPDGVEVCAAADMEAAQAVLAESRVAAAMAAAATFAPEPPAVATPGSASAVAVSAMPDAGAQDVSAELRSLRRLLEQQLATLSWNDFSRREPERVRVVDELQLLGVARATAVRLMERFPLPLDRPWGTADVAAWLATELRTVALPGAAGGAVALVGPAGAGKSTTLAKLAAREVLQHGAAGLALVSADTARLGAAEQTRTLGRLLGVSTHSVVDAEELAALWPALQRKRLVLIDTGGVANRDAIALQQLRQLLSVMPGTQSVLVLPASAQDAVLRECIHHWRNCGGLVAALTRMDETTTVGTAIAELIAAGIPLGALSNGPRIPEDLAVADAASVCARLLAAVPPAIRTTSGEQQHAA
jgi:flagellar biosynthesis protein FlhF